MFTSTVGFSMDMHYCQDELKSIAFFGKAKSCHDVKETKTCHHSKKTSSNSDEGDFKNIDQDNCCHNENLTVEKSNLDAPNPELGTLNHFQLKFISTNAVAFIYKYNKNKLQNNFRKYIPPLPQHNTQVLFQTFLI